MDQLIEELQVQFQQQSSISLQDFDFILKTFAVLDESFKLDQNQTNSLYMFLKDKIDQIQLNHVIEFIFFIKENNLVQNNNRISVKQNLNYEFKILSKLSHVVMPLITAQFYHDFTLFVQILFQKKSVVTKTEIIEKQQELKLNLRINLDDQILLFDELLSNDTSTLSEEFVQELINEIEHHIYQNSTQDKTQKGTNFNNVNIYQMNDQFKEENLDKLVQYVLSSIQSVSSSIVKDDIIKRFIELKNFARAAILNIISQQENIIDLKLQTQLITSKYSYLEIGQKKQQEQTEKLLFSLDQLQEENAMLAENMEYLQNQNKEVLNDLKQITSLETQIVDLQRKYAEQNSKYNSLKNEYDHIKQNNVELISIIRQMEENQQNCEETTTRQSVQNIIERESISQLQIKQQYDEMKQQNQEMQEYIESLNLQLDQTKNKLAYYSKQFELQETMMTKIRNSTASRNSINNVLSRLSSSRLSRVSNFRNSHVNNRLSNLKMTQNNPIKVISEIEEDQTTDLQKTILTDGRDSSVLNQDNISVYNQFWDAFQAQEFQKNRIKEQADIQYRFLQFDESQLYLNDFLGIMDNKKIKDILKQERTEFQDIIQKCYTEQVFQINEKGQSKVRNVLLTQNNFYILGSKLELKKVINHKHILQIFQIVNNSTIFIIQTNKKEHYVLQSFKKADLINFINQQLTTQIQVQTVEDLSVNLGDNTVKVGQILKKNKKNVDQQNVYQSSYKSGVLAVYTHRFFSKKWKKQFMILCSVGIIVFKDKEDLEPVLFIPLSNALVIKNPIEIPEKQQFSMLIKYPDSETEFFLSGVSEAEKEEWFNLINTVCNQIIKQEIMMQKQKKKE